MSDKYKSAIFSLCIRFKISYSESSVLLEHRSTLMRSRQLVQFIGFHKSSRLSLVYSNYLFNNITKRWILGIDSPEGLNFLWVILIWLPVILHYHCNPIVHVDLSSVQTSAIILCHNFGISIWSSCDAYGSGKSSDDHDNPESYNGKQALS